MSTIEARCSVATRVGTARGRPAGAADRTRLLLRRTLDLLLMWGERAHQRRQLQLLTERDLRDLGLTLADVDDEVSKPFWRH